MNKAIHMNTSAISTRGAAQSDNVAAGGARMSSSELALQTFHKDFGEHQAQLTTLVVDGEPWFKGSEAAAALGYAAPAKAVRTHVDAEDRQRPKRSPFHKATREPVLTFQGAASIR